MENNYIIKSVINIASQYSGISIDKLSVFSSINNDLRIDGDDIEDMLIEIDREFNLNFDGFEFNKYFNSENESNIISNIINLFRKKKNLIEYDVKLIDIIRWIEDGCWKEVGST